MTEDWELDRRRSWESFFDLMEEYRSEYPEATDDECFDAVCFHTIPDRVSAAVDAAKESRREQH